MKIEKNNAKGVGEENEAKEKILKYWKTFLKQENIKKHFCRK